MSSFLPHRPGDLPGQAEPTSIQDPRKETERQRFRWEVRAAQWRALGIARAIWGDGAAASLEGYPARGDFRGLLRLEVPCAGVAAFDPEAHREREDLFVRAAALDPLLARVPLVYVFDLAIPEPERPAPVGPVGRSQRAHPRRAPSRRAPRAPSQRRGPAPAPSPVAGRNRMPGR